MITVTVTDIDWDLTGDNDGEFDGNEIEYRDHINDEYANGRQYTLDCDDDPDCITQELSDILSDRSGWCMHSIDWDKAEGDTSKNYRYQRREDNPHPEARVYDDDNREYANDDRDDYYEETDRIECVECGNDCDPEDVDENTGRCDRCSVSVSRNPETKTFRIDKKTAIRIYDNSGESTDRYTVVFDGPEWSHVKRGMKMFLGLSEGGRSFSQFGECSEGNHLGKLISWNHLSDETKAHIRGRVTTSATRATKKPSRKLLPNPRKIARR